MKDAIKHLSEVAAKLPETTASKASMGTAIAKRTFTTGGKAFVFLGAKAIMVKLRESRPEAGSPPGAESLQRSKDGVDECRLKEGDCPSMQLLESWIRESDNLFAARKIEQKATKKTRPRARGAVE